MEADNPFTYPLTTYLFIVLLSSFAGAVKCINNLVRKKMPFSFLQLLSDVLTGGLAGLMSFWICDSLNVTGSMVYFSVAVSGIMGIRAWDEFERILKQILRIPEK